MLTIQNPDCIFIIKPVDEIYYNIDNFMNGISDIDTITTITVVGYQNKNILPKLTIFPRLYKLILTRDWSSSLDDSIGVLVTLKSLTLCNCSFDYLSPALGNLGNLINLQGLYLYHNQLSLLPSEIGNLKKLKKLNLNGNQLSLLPSEIGNLINLQHLYLDNNQLSSLPSEIGNLIKLQELWLQNNQLSSLPIEILKIKNCIFINETSYDINNLDLQNEILIFSELNEEITNLPINIKEIWLNKKYNNIVNIKLPFECIIIFF
jgi:Leucine-rich repeat (LRR) protein